MASMRQPLDPGEPSMPLRDHFRPPLSQRMTWEGLHGGWPMVIVQKLFPILPPGFVAAPGVHVGAEFEVDVSAYDENDPGPPEAVADPGVEGGTAVATLPIPTLTTETQFPDQDEYEVRIYDDRFDRRLVAAIELISPANKDRPASRAALAAKVAALLHRGVCVSLVDIVTIRRFNLYAEVLELFGVVDPALGTAPPPLYAVTLRGRRSVKRRSRLECWFHPLEVGRSLPTLPLWLEEQLSVPLELEVGYEECCRFLRIA